MLIYHVNNDLMFGIIFNIIWKKGNEFQQKYDNKSVKLQSVCHRLLICQMKFSIKRVNVITSQNQSDALCNVTSPLKYRQSPYGGLFEFLSTIPLSLVWSEPIVGDTCPRYNAMKSSLELHD